MEIRHFNANAKQNSGGSAILMLLIVAITSIVVVGIQYRAETIISSASVINLSIDLIDLRAHIKDRVSCSRTVNEAIERGKYCGGRFISKQGDEDLFEYTIPELPPEDEENPRPTCQENPFLYGFMTIGDNPPWKVAIQNVQTGSARKVVVWARPGGRTIVNGKVTTIDHPSLSHFIRAGSLGLFLADDQLCLALPE